MKPNSYSKNEILDHLKASFKSVYEYCHPLSEETLSQKAIDKWSIRENLEHLILSCRPVANALNMPKITFLAFGKSKKGSRSMDILVTAYKEVLAEGGVATSKYVPEEKNIKPRKEELLMKWQRIIEKFETNLNAWTEEELDKHRIPHPLLGKLTFREMLYFTIHHNQHHLNAMKEQVN